MPTAGFVNKACRHGRLSCLNVLLQDQAPASFHGAPMSCTAPCQILRGNLILQAKKRAQWAGRQASGSECGL